LSYNHTHGAIYACGLITKLPIRTSVYNLGISR